MKLILLGIEITIVVIGLLFLITQILIPLFTNRPFFPILRVSHHGLVAEALDEADQWEQVEAAKKIRSTIPVPDVEPVEPTQEPPFSQREQEAFKETGTSRKVQRKSSKRA